MLELRPFQRQAISALTRAQPQHVICISPTGSGKSLIYERVCQEPSRRSVLVTPLVALGRQQSKRLAALGLKVWLGSDGPKKSGRESGVWILSPESATLPAIFNRLKNWEPQFLAVDECHCFWEWGESFRPAFAELPGLPHRLAIERSLWMSATLPPGARTILHKALPGPVLEIGRFSLPPQLHLAVVKMSWPQRLDWLSYWLAGHPEPGIVFCGTRALSEKLAAAAIAQGRRALCYHAGFSSEERLLLEKRVGEQKTDVVFATSAFGMGMDFGHLRWSVLWRAPTSLLELAQSIGRVARQSAGQGIVLWDEEDFGLTRWAANTPRSREAAEQVQQFFFSKGCWRSALTQLIQGDDSASDCAGRCNRCVL